MTKSPLQIARGHYQPKMPAVLKGHVTLREGAATQSVADQAEIKQLFPNTYGMPLITFEAGEAKEHPAVNVGVILSGGQAPGGHNVISGLYDGLKALNPANKLYGFLGGPSGLVDHKYLELTGNIIDEYRNTGGFDIIGSGRTKLEETEQYEKGAEICRQLGIKAIVIIGGDDSNTNACVLAEYYKQKNYGIQVIGCPKTIDGDLKNEMIETSFGFDTACKVYSELIGNIQRDANSAKKYWHFIRLMGRSASHIALECALQTHPNICLISEEVEKKGMGLNAIADYIIENYFKPGFLFKDADFRHLAMQAFLEKHKDSELVPDFQCSPGFIQDFKKRNDLSTRRAHYKRRPVLDAEKLAEWKESMRRLVESVSNDRIVNADETAWRILPNGCTTWATRGADAVTINTNDDEKKMVTVMASVTASGRKLPLMVIATGKRHR